MIPTKSRAQIFADMADPIQLKYQRDPVRWAIERARVEIWSKQREIMEAVRDHPKVAIKSCHSAGKSFTMGLLAAWWIDAHPQGEARFVSTAPTGAQVDGVLWNEINSHHVRIGDLPGHVNKREWYIGRFLAGVGRKPPDHSQAAFQGLHARKLLVIFDEAYGIPLHLWTEGSSLASNEGARMVAVGNPDGPGEFEKMCQPDSGWHVIHISYRHTPNFTDEPVSALLKEMLIGRSWVEDRRHHWGEDSALFTSKCEGDFPKQGSPWQVVPYAWAAACRWLESQPSGEVEAGVDVGGGNDRTVVTIRQGPAILHVDVFTSPDPVTTVGRIASVLREWKVVRAKVDSIGIGWGIYGGLRESSSRHFPYKEGTAHEADIVPINVGMAPTPGNENRFLNRRAEMWWDIGRELSRLKNWDFSRLDQDTQNTLIHELTMPMYEIMDSKGRVKIEAKEKIIERLGASPDIAESALLAFVPANWAADIRAAGLMSAPSLLDSYGAGDLIAPGVGLSALGSAGSWSSGRGGWVDGL